jgi:hypothetical protein
MNPKDDDVCGVCDRGIDVHDELILRCCRKCGVLFCRACGSDALEVCRLCEKESRRK